MQRLLWLYTYVCSGCIRICMSLAVYVCVSSTGSGCVRVRICSACSGLIRECSARVEVPRRPDCIGPWPSRLVRTGYDPHPCSDQVSQNTWKVDVRLPGKGNSNSHGARPVHQTISMIKWIRTNNPKPRTPVGVIRMDGAVDHGPASPRRH